MRYYEFLTVLPIVLHGQNFKIPSKTNLVGSFNMSWKTINFMSHHHPKNTVSAKVKFSKIRPKSPSSSARSASSCGQPRDWVPWRRCDRTANLRTRGWRPSGHSWSNPSNHLGHGTPASNDASKICRSQQSSDFFQPYFFLLMPFAQNPWINFLHSSRC